MSPRPRRLLLAVAIAACAAVGCTEPGSQAVSAGGDSPVGGGAAPAPSVPGAEVPASDIAARFGDAVWRVETDGCGWLGRGSAFAIGPRHLVTNYHVIANDTSPLLVSRGGAVRQGRVIGAAEEPDVAVIEVAEDLPLALSWAPAAGLQAAERLVLIGFPRPEYRFTFSSGSIVNFLGPKDAREAVLSNAPIDRGNSGGPALRGDGTVAGIVTQMTLGDPSERVAIVFTADTVAGTVDRALRQPTEVLSTCGLGPDYVPPLPPGYDVPEPPPAPPPDASHDVAASTSSPPTSAPRTTAPPTVACPSGRVLVEVEEMTTTPAAEPGWWEIAGRGTVTNGTSAAVTVAELEATIQGDDEFREPIPPDGSELAPAQSTTWTMAPARAYSPGRAPVVVVTVTWRWSDRAFGGCPPP